MYTTHDGTKLYYEVHGSGEPVLFVHGFPLSSRLWQDAAATLGDRYRIIVPDLRGHGRSDASDVTSMTQMAGDLVAVLDAAEERRPVILVGLSMGGYIAMEMARLQPLRIRALVLADTRHDADAQAKVQEREAVARRVLAEGSQVVADGMVSKLFADTAPQRLKDEWRGIMAATPPKGVAAALRAMGARIDSAETLKGWQAPCLIVVGESDVITPPEVARQMQSLVTGSQLEIILGAGHMTPVEQPGLFTGALRAFFAKLPPLTA